MSDTLDLAPPQRAPVLRANPSGRSVGHGAEQSLGFVVYGSPYPFEDGAEQSFPGNAPPIFAFEDGAE